MSLFSSMAKLVHSLHAEKEDPDAWMDTASLKELDDAYEIERQKWMEKQRNGGGDSRSVRMQKLNRKISEAVARENEKKPKYNGPHEQWTDANRWDKD